MTKRPPGFRPLVPDVAPVTKALERSETLSSLMDRLRASQACLAAAKSCLPPPLAAHLKSGSFDHEGWTLLVPNAAVSAKLRQFQPYLMGALAKRGLKVTAIRVKVQQAG